MTVTVGSESCLAWLEGGSGSCSLALPAVGAYSIQAYYTGDSAFATSQDDKAHTVILFPSVTMIVGDAPDPSQPGQPFTITVLVTSAYGIPGGVVTLTAGSEICVVTLSNGAGGCALALVEPQTYTLTASYAGDALFAPSAALAWHTVEPPASHWIFLPVVWRQNGASR